LSWLFLVRNAIRFEANGSITQTVGALPQLQAPALRSLLVFDLTTMVMNGGCEQTEDECRRLLSQNGVARWPGRW